MSVLSEIISFKCDLYHFGLLLSVFISGRVHVFCTKLRVGRVFVLFCFLCLCDFLFSFTNKLQTNCPMRMALHGNSERTRERRATIGAGRTIDSRSGRQTSPTNVWVAQKKITFCHLVGCILCKYSQSDNLFARDNVSTRSNRIISDTLRSQIPEQPVRGATLASRSSLFYSEAVCSFIYVTFILKRMHLIFIWCMWVCVCVCACVCLRSQLQFKAKIIRSDYNLAINSAVRTANFAQAQWQRLLVCAFTTWANAFRLRRFEMSIACWRIDNEKFIWISADLWIRSSHAMVCVMFVLSDLPRLEICRNLCTRHCHLFHHD